MNKMVNSVIITGAAEGIGKEISRYFAQKKYKLYLLDINYKKLQELQNSLKNINSNIKIKKVDIRNLNEIKTFFSSIKTEPIRVLVNNAGVLKKGFWKLKNEDLQEMLNTNLLGSYYMIKEIMPKMRKQKYGYIFNISSQSAKRVREETGGYSISKWGQLAINELVYNEILEAESLKFGIKITALCPSVVNTKMAKELGYIMEETIEIEDIVNTIDYLLKLGKNASIKEICIDCVNSKSRKNI